MDNKRKWEDLIIGNKPIECEQCRGKVIYVGGGRYRCEVCGSESLDDFGKVKEYLEKHGPTPALIVSEATGVYPEIIEMFLKKGKLEIPEGSRYYLKCEKCGCSIRYGRFCPSCVNDLAGSIRAMFYEDIGERPKYEMTGRMHYLNNRKI